MTAVLQDQPLPARLVPWVAAQPASLRNCVLLALLLHLWAVLMLGNAPGGTARPGQGVFGAINVTLRGPAAPGASEPSPPASPAPGLSPDSEAARWGGRVRQTELPPQSLPGAERLGVPAPQAPQALPVSPSPQALPVNPSSQALPVTPPPETPPPVPEPAPVERNLSASGLTGPRGSAADLPKEPSAAADMPALQSLPTPAAAPAALRQLQAAPMPPAPRPAETALPRPTPSDVTPAANTPALPAVPALPAPGTLVQSPGTAGPDAGSRIGHDVPTPAAQAASQPPRLNLELARPRGGELSRYATPGALPVLPRPPERDEKLAREIEKAGKTDCRKAYAGAGVLAVVPLVADAVRGEGCKW